MAYYPRETVTKPSSETETENVYLVLEDVQPDPSDQYDGTKPPHHVAVTSRRTAQSQRGGVPKTKRRKVNRTALILIALVMIVLLVVILGVQVWGNRRLAQVIAEIPNTNEGKTSSDTVQKQLDKPSGVTSLPDRLSNAGVECVVKAGRDAGQPFDDHSIYMDNGRITALELKVDPSRGKLTAIRARYGETFTTWRGDNYGQIQRFNLKKDEVITSLKMFVGDYRPHVGVIGLVIGTSKGKNFFYGTNDTDVISVTTGTWNEVLYFSGRAGGLIDTLVVHSLGCSNVGSDVVLSKMPETD